MFPFFRELLKGFQYFLKIVSAATKTIALYKNEKCIEYKIIIIIYIFAIFHYYNIFNFNFSRTINHQLSFIQNYKKIMKSLQQFLKKRKHYWQLFYMFFLFMQNRETIVFLLLFLTKCSIYCYLLPKLFLKELKSLQWFQKER